MTYRVAICEDNRNDADYIQNIIKEWNAQKQCELFIEHFTSAESFLFRYADDKAWDILLLDIEMQEMDGVNLAKKIREVDEAVQIVFVTGFPDFVGEGYEVAALHYLMKPVHKEKLYTVLDRAVKILQNKDTAERTIVLPTEEGLRRIAVQEIIYAESFAHNVRLTTQSESFIVRMSISRVEEILGESYVRCHRSYLVGVKHIARLSKSEVVLDSGKTLPMSRSAVTVVQRAFVNCFAGGDLYETV